MQCPACGAENRDGRRFCAACGARLNVACPACGAANEPGEAFCGECGTPLRSQAATEAPTSTAASPPSPTPEAAPAARRERKVATILFADLVGFTGLNEAHDPELVQALVSRAFDRLSQEVVRYEGLVEKFAGDAMLALFGVPQSHEDDAERAVRAALEMLSTMAELAAEARASGRPELSLRIGIETGEVLVDQGRAAAERDRMVTGDPVNTAARLEAAAAIGSVIVGPGTYAATRAVVDYEELPPLALKGKALPVSAWRAVAVKARRGGVRTPLGIQAALVGRDAEMALLKETVRRSVAEQRPHLVTVIGAAGVGKSRITWEVEKYLDGLPEAYIWRKGRCLAYGQTSLGAIAEMLRADAGIRDDDAAPEGTEKLDRRLGGLPSAFSAPEREVLRGVAGLRDVPQVARDELFDVLQRWLEALAQTAPAVLVFEDIHWADEGLLDLIESVSRWGRGPVLLLALARHELQERRPSWAGGIPNATTIVLEPLGANENARLVEGLMPGGIPPELQSRIVQLADGNPLFTEELVRMFVDRGVIRFVDGRWQLAQAIDDLEIPGSVQAVLAARLDALPQREKQLAQDAAVVGRIFWDAVLAFLGGDRPARVDDLLRRLRVKELVVPREPSSLSGASEFSFRHVLIRDVAYDSLPKQDRATKHLAVAQWAERELGERSEELAELLASHYLSALRYREEFGASAADLRGLREQAYRQARAATERAGRLYERAAATRWALIAIDLARALELGPTEQAAAAWAFLRHGVGYWAMEDAEPIAKAALAALTTVESPDPDLVYLEAAITSYLAWALKSLDRTDEGRRLVEQLLERLDGVQTARAAHALLAARLGWIMWRDGEAVQAIPLLAQALADARAVADRWTEGWATHELGIAKAYAGDIRTGAELLRESLEIAREVGDSSLITRVHTNLPSLLMDYGAPWDEIEALLHEGLTSARRSSDRLRQGWGLFQLGQAEESQGRFVESSEHLQESIRIADELGERPSSDYRRFAFGWSLALQGRWDEAVALTDPLDLRLGADEQIRKVSWHAWQTWRTDPSAAVEQLSADLVTPQQGQIHGVLMLSRMCFRTGSSAGAEAADRLEPSTGGEVPMNEALRHWIGLLIGPAKAAADGLAATMAELGARGYRMLELMAAADLALALAREGRDPASALALVSELEEAMGAASTLGAVPETRWLSVPESASAPA